MLSKTCHTGGVLEGYTVAFKGPNDSITSLQLPCSVTERTATNSPRAYLARRCVHWPFCGTLTATLKATVTPGGGSVACPGHMASKEKSQDSLRFILH